MAVSSTVTLTQYVGNNSTVTPYPTGFRFLDNDHLRVQIMDEEGGVSELSEGEDYTATGAGDPTQGEITTSIAYDETYTITILRRTPVTQLLDLLYNDRLPAEQLEAAFDKLTLIVQELSGGSATGNRAIQFPFSESSSNNTVLPVPVERRGSLTHFDSVTGEMNVISYAALAAVLAPLITGFDTSVFASITGDNIFTGANAFLNNVDFENPVHFEGRVSFDVQTLPDGATITMDCSQGNMATLTLGGNRTFANPVSVAAGTYVVRVIQDGTGNRTLAFGSNFKFPGGSTPALSTAANAVDVLTFVNFSGTNLYLVAQKSFS